MSCFGIKLLHWSGFFSFFCEILRDEKNRRDLIFGLLNDLNWKLLLSQQTHQNSNDANFVPYMMLCALSVTNDVFYLLFFVISHET